MNLAEKIHAARGAALSLLFAGLGVAGILLFLIWLKARAGWCAVLNRAFNEAGGLDHPLFRDPL